MTRSYAPRELAIGKGGAPLHSRHRHGKESETLMKATNKIRVAAAPLSVALLFQGCVVGPRYNRPTVQTPGTFKEVTPR